MIFNSLDFNVSTRNCEEPVKLMRPLRSRINHVVDAYSLRIPNKVRTGLFHTLNVCDRYQQTQIVPFFALEGIGMVEIVDASIGSIHEATHGWHQEVVSHAKDDKDVFHFNAALPARHSS